jgi:hypothetical protein
MKSITEWVRVALIASTLIFINRWCEISMIFVSIIGESSPWYFKIMGKVGTSWAVCYLIYVITYVYIFDYMIKDRDLPIIGIPTLLLIVANFFTAFLASSVIEWLVFPMTFGYGIWPARKWDWVVMIIGMIAGLNWIWRKRAGPPQTTASAGFS